MKSRVTILITIDLLDHYMLNIRRDHTSNIMHALCFNCLLKCSLVNAMPGNISSTILSALRVYELFFPLSFVEDLCKDISVEYITPACVHYSKDKQTLVYCYMYTIYMYLSCHFFRCKNPFLSFTYIVLFQCLLYTCIVFSF